MTSVTDVTEKPFSRRAFLKGGGALVVAFSLPASLGGVAQSRDGKSTGDRPAHRSTTS